MQPPLHGAVTVVWKCYLHCKEKGGLGRPGPGSKWAVPLLCETRLCPNCVTGQFLAPPEVTDGFAVFLPNFPASRSMIN